MTIRNVQYTRRIDAAGSWSVTLPLLDPSTQIVQSNRIWRHFQEGVGFLFAGRISKVEKAGENDLVVGGNTILEELVDDMVLPGTVFENTLVDDVIDDLLHTSNRGWTRSGSAGSATFTGDLSYQQTLKCLIDVVNQANYHIREKVTYVAGALVKEVEISELGTSSDVLITGGPGDIDNILNPNRAYAGDLSVEESSEQICNWVVPLGAGEGSVQLNLRHQTRLPNLVTNPSFEPNLNGWSQSLGTGTITSSTANFFDGVRSCRIDAGVSGVTQINQSINGIVGSGTYRFEVWANVISGLPRIVIDWWTTGFGSFLGSAFVDAAGTGRRKISLTATAPSTAGAARIWIACEATEEAYVDMVRFWRKASEVGLVYDVETALNGSDNGLVWYIQDETSVTTEGRKQRPFVSKKVAPLSPTTAALQAAANALYDMAVVQLSLWSTKTFTYTIPTYYLDQDVKPGDLVYVRWKGLAQDWRGVYIPVDVDQELHVLARGSTFNENGIELNSLTVSNKNELTKTDAVALIGQLRETDHEFQISIQTSVSNWTMGPMLEELNSTNPADFDLVIPDNVVQLLRCKLRVKPRAIRSTATGASSGGGATSSSDTSHTHSINGGTSGGEASHSHSVSGQSASSGGGTTTSESGSHRHQVGLISDATDTWGMPNPSNTREITIFNSTGLLGHVLKVGDDSSGGTFDGWYTVEEFTDHDHTVAAHTHSVTGTTSGSGSSHSHSVTGSTSGTGSSHSHSVAAHTHSQTYGIFEGSSADDLELIIDGTNVTTELGGPWTSTFEVDITGYFLDSAGVVDQGVHDIRIESSTLGRVEVYADWIAAVAPFAVPL